MTTACRGIRGATTAGSNTKEASYDATKELFSKLVEVNQVKEATTAAVLFTTTQDLNAAFPATVVRNMGWTRTALMGSQEIAVPDGLSKCIRVLILVNTDKGPDELVNIYLRGAVTLRSESDKS